MWGKLTVEQKDIDKIELRILSLGRFLILKEKELFNLDKEAISQILKSLRIFNQ